MKIVNNKKFKIAIDIDDCMCNTVDIDFAYGYYYSKQNNIFLKTKYMIVPIIMFQQLLVLMINKHTIFFVNEKNIL